MQSIFDIPPMESTMQKHFSPSNSIRGSSKSILFCSHMPADGQTVIFKMHPHSFGVTWAKTTKTHKCRVLFSKRTHVSAGKYCHKHTYALHRAFCRQEKDATWPQTTKIPAKNAELSLSLAIETHHVHFDVIHGSRTHSPRFDNYLDQKVNAQLIKGMLPYCRTCNQFMEADAYF